MVFRTTALTARTSAVAPHQASAMPHWANGSPHQPSAVPHRASAMPHQAYATTLRHGIVTQAHQCSITDHDCKGELLPWPCGHWMCVDGLQNMRSNQCPLCRQQHDLHRMLLDNGYTPEPQAVTSPISAPITHQPTRRKRTRTQQDDMPSCRETIAKMMTPGFATEEWCSDPTCRKHVEPLINNMWSREQPTYDIPNSGFLTSCPCGAERTITKMMFTDCPVHLQGFEIFQGGHLQKFQWSGHATGKTIVFPTRGVFMQLLASTEVASPFEKPEDTTSETRHGSEPIDAVRVVDEDDENDEGIAVDTGHAAGSFNPRSSPPESTGITERVKNMVPSIPSWMPGANAIQQCWSAKCASCRGTRKTWCLHCDGYGCCPDCKGTGSTGMPCRFCAGQPEASCASCHGTQQMICQLCHGYVGYRCQDCNGEGKIACGICAGPPGDAAAVQRK